MPTAPAPIAKSLFGIIASAPLLWKPGPGWLLHFGVFQDLSAGTLKTTFGVTFAMSRGAHATGPAPSARSRGYAAVTNSAITRVCLMPRLVTERGCSYRGSDRRRHGASFRLP
jgi:hypothetical protein